MAASHQSMEEDKKVLQELSVQEVQLKDTDEQSLKVRSYVSGSHRTKGSRASQISMAAAQARADAEAAKARAAYSRKEKELTIEKARLEAELDALRQDRDADAANAKALVMEAAAAEGSYRSSLASLESLPKEQNVREKVSEYVANHTYIEHSHYEEELDLTPQTPQLPAQPTHIQEHNTSTPAQPSALPDNGMQQRFGPQQPHMQSPVSQWVDREQRMSQVNMGQTYSSDIALTIAFKEVIVSLKDGLCSINNVYEGLINAHVDSMSGQCSNYNCIREQIVKAKQSLEQSEQMGSRELKVLDGKIEILTQNEGKLEQELSDTKQILDDLRTEQMSNENLLKQSGDALRLGRTNLNSTRERLQKQEERKRNAAIVTGVGAGLLVIPVIGWIAGVSMLIGGGVEIDQALRAVRAAEEQVRNFETQVKMFKSKVAEYELKISQTELNIKQKQDKVDKIREEIQKVKHQREAVAEFQKKVRGAVQILNILSGTSTVAEIQTRRFILLEPIMKVMEDLMKAAGEITGNYLLSTEEMPKLLETMRKNSSKLAAICASSSKSEIESYY
ncbi:hypothetical protein MHYP_G00306970 [Metynnis hypsauchen]